MTVINLPKVNIPYYEAQIISGDPQQLNDWVRDLVKVLQEFADNTTERVNLQLLASNVDVAHFGSQDELGEWIDGTWRLIRISEDDFQLQKRVSGEWVKNTGYAQDN